MIIIWSNTSLSKEALFRLLIACICFLISHYAVLVLFLGGPHALTATYFTFFIVHLYMGLCLPVWVINGFQERFYFGDNVLPCFESGIPLLKHRLHQLPDSNNVSALFIFGSNLHWEVVLLTDDTELHYYCWMIGEHCISRWGSMETFLQAAPALSHGILTNCFYPWNAAIKFCWSCSKNLENLLIPNSTISLLIDCWSDLKILNWK